MTGLLPSLALVMAAATQGPFVLAVGVNDPGGAGLETLRYADDDAAEAVRLFGASTGRSYLHTYFDADSTERHSSITAEARPPTRAALAKSVEAMRAQIAAQSAIGELPHVVVWLSGHGAYDKDGHFYFPLANQERLTSKQLVDDIIAPLEGAHRIHLVVDTCFAGSFVNSRAQFESTEPTDVDAAFTLVSPERFGHVGVLTASTAGTRSFEWSEISSGVFSAIVRAGLRGAADVDGDGEVRYSEMLSFATSAAEGVRVPEARLRVSATPPAIDKDGPLTRRAWLGPTAVLRGELASYGTVHILDGDGRWLLASRFEPGFTPELWLPSEKPLFLRAKGADHRLTLGDDGSFAIGARTAQTTGARSLLEDALREGLFAFSWGPSYWRGFSAAQTVSATGSGLDPSAEEGSAGFPWLAAGTSAVAGVVVVSSLAALGGAVAFYILYAQETRQLPALQLYAATAVTGGLGLGGLLAAIVVGGVSGALWLAGE